MVGVVLAVWLGLQAPETTLTYRNMAKVEKVVAGRFKWVTVTAYCSCSKCCTKSDGITASGKKVKLGMIAASRGMKFGTRIRIRGKIYTVEDRLSRRFDDRIDIWFPSHEQAKRFGKQRIKIEILD